LVKLAQVAALGTAAVLIAPASAGAAGAPGVTDFTVAAKRDTEPIVLTGAQLGDWSVPANQTAKLPLTDVPDCPNPDGATRNKDCSHNQYVPPEADSGNRAGDGTPTHELLGYHWDGHAFQQIPFQVDEQFTRYLQNSASGFAAYSGDDQHTTYAYDREGFRWTNEDPSNPCLARPASPVATDPVKGLDSNDEVAFMASDAGPQAPPGATLPHGIASVREIRVVDPYDAQHPNFVYIMKAKAGGPESAFSASNGYVHYERDAGADIFAKSISGNKVYGSAPAGRYCDAQGKLVTKPDGTPDVQERRPRDGATVTTDRYRFRYDGRWMMTSINVSPDGGATYGPDLIDRWKARAFAQDPGSKNPCCGFEDEDVNWGGSSILLGEKVGPVRAIRETWGADSGTNVIRRETFYRDEVRQKSWLRVHPIPPLDGIYAQWDFNAGVMTRFYNATKPDGVDVDGRNDEMFGNFDDPCNQRWNGNGTGAIDQGYRSAYAQLTGCRAPYHFSIDPGDPTFGGVNAALSWSLTSGPSGSIVDRIQIDKLTDVTAGGAAQDAVAVPYYRDDSCFDDGTGTDPGPRLRPGEASETTTAPSDGTPRRCWSKSDGTPNSSDHFYQGSIATHGLHLLLIAESDNARQTVPVDEVVAEQRLVMLPGPKDGSVGEQYGRGFEKPLETLAAPFQGTEPTAAPAGGGQGGGGGGSNGGGSGGGGPSGGGGGQGTPPRVAASQKAGSPAATPARRSAAARKRAAKRRRAAKRKRAARRQAKQNRRHA
jgi:hypothetical protein